jgi:hypothetical protein
MANKPNRAERRRLAREQKAVMGDQTLPVPQPTPNEIPPAPIEKESLWRGVFGWEHLFRWDVLGSLVPGVFLAVGVGMLGVEWFPNNLLISQICFSIGCLMVIAKTVGQARSARNSSLLSRLVFGVVVCGVALTITVTAIWSIESHKRPGVNTAVDLSGKSLDEITSKLKDAANQNAAVPAKEAGHPLTKEDLDEALKRLNGISGKERKILASVRSGIISTGPGGCAALMSLFGGRTVKEPVVVTPIIYFVWLRLASDLDYSAVIDNFSMDVSHSVNGPWSETLALPLGSSVFYSRHPSPVKLSDGTYEQSNELAFKGMFGSLVHGGKTVMSPHVYQLKTSDEDDCVRAVDPLKFDTLEDRISKGIPPHGNVAGWAGFNPPINFRSSEDTGNLVYRLTIHSSTDTFISYGTLRAPYHVFNSDEATLTKIEVVNGPMSLSHPIYYVGPKQ